MNQAPTDLTLSQSTINENEPMGAVIGTFSTVAPDMGDPFTYSLVSGVGSTDNDLFILQNNQLKSKTLFDYETKNSYTIRVKTTDKKGSSFEKALTLTINNIADPVVTTPINNVVATIDAANTTINLGNNFDDPLTTGLVAQFNLANTSAGTIGKGVIKVALFDQAGTGAPLTVQNFQSYVNSGSYTHSFIHRSVPGFIIQGGGYTFNNLTLGTIPSNAPVQNEFNLLRSNLRGTIAMAKLGNNPNSATNQWFFNLADNSSNLNNQNGGFTAFGQVLSSDDLATIDAIAAVKTYPYNSPFTNLPLVQNVLQDSNFIRFSSVTVTQEEELTYSIVGNSKPTLVTPSITGQQLTLDYLPNQTGQTAITVRATNLLKEFIDYTFTVTVLPTITLAINTSSIQENSAQNLDYTFTRNGDLSEALTVNFTVGGTASLNTDYSPAGATSFTGTTGTVTFAAGSSTQTLTIDPMADSAFESNESIILKLATGNGYTVGTTANVTGILLNDDALPTLSLSPNSTLVEGKTTPQNAIYAVTLSNPSSQRITVQYATTDGTAIAGSDYTATTGTLVFNPGVTQRNIRVPILNNNLNEADETYTLKLNAPTNASLGTLQTVTTTLTDTLTAPGTTSLPVKVENLTLTGIAAINGTGNEGNNILTGNNANNTLMGETGNDVLIGARGADTLVGGLGRDRFDYRVLSDSLLSNFDQITDFTATPGNDLFRVSTVPTALVNGGMVASLDAIDIGARLTSTTFVAHGAARFTVGTRSFVAINDANAGFNANADAIIEVTGLTGTLALGYFTLT